MNIIITGHRGLIGSYLKKRLEQEGHKVVMGIDKREGREVKILNNFTLALGANVDMFIHCASNCKINQIIENPLLGLENVRDFQTVLEFCRKNKIPKFICFSSSRILSKEKNPYTASKIYGEELTKAYKECYGIDYLIIRPSTVYGSIKDDTRRLMYIFITNALLGRDLEIYGNPKTKTLDFTFIDDFIDAMILVINSEWNKEYNISGEQEHNVYDLAEFIIKETGSSSKIVIKDEEIAQPQQVSVDISEIRKLGYNPKVSLEEGVKKNIEFCKRFMEERGMI
ncbi:MAG: NAD(P)-dependent oxidoreductase [archaeon]